MQKTIAHISETSGASERWVKIMLAVALVGVSAFCGLAFTLPVLAVDHYYSGGDFPSWRVYWVYTVAVFGWLVRIVRSAP